MEVYVAAILAALAGTTLASTVLERMSNDSFRKYTRIIVLAVGAVSIAQGLRLLLIGEA
jgi:uncharacterized membrane protein YfcA